MFKDLSCNQITQLYLRHLWVSSLTWSLLHRLLDGNCQIGIISSFIWWYQVEADWDPIKWGFYCFLPLWGNVFVPSRHSLHSWSCLFYLESGFCTFGRSCGFKFSELHPVRCREVSWQEHKIIRVHWSEWL